MKDSASKRIKAIEVLVGGDVAFDIDAWRYGINKIKTKEDALKMLKDASEIIGNVYKLSHGWNSKCCKGSGAHLIEPLLKSKR